jgi:DNA-binding NarL/FixJ family response regulator
MGVAAQPPAEHVVEALRRTHLRTIAEADRVILRARVSGESVPQIAAEAAFAQPTVYRHIDEIMGRVFAIAGVSKTGWLEGVWCFLHLECCLG